ncbi:zinc-ribbon domain-containing protein [uncultured Bilophila sp.]
MALVSCPECGKEISDAAQSCPHCGYELKKHL